MGTSTSYGGPTGKPPLLPPWASPPEDPSENPDGSPGDDTNSSPDNGDSSPDENVAGQGSSGVGTYWAGAKRTMTSYAKGGGKASLSKAGRRYVRAQGGAKTAASTAAIGRASTARLGAFLATAATSGARVALEKVGLSDVVGKDLDTVLAIIIDSIAPNSSSLEEAAARKATAEVMERLYEELDLEDNSIEALDNMPSDYVAGAIFESIQMYIFNRWLEDLGQRIEKNAISAHKAVQLEREMKQYIQDRLKLELKESNVLTIDWEGQAGQDIIRTLYEDAYYILEVSE